MKNYYQILNIKPTATENEIKSSYRVLAKKYHPDVNPGNSAAADKFADINEANAVLSDPKSRAEYDAKLKESMSGRLNPESVIAKQRAQAQAAARQAARQAAFRNSGMNMNNMNVSAMRDATIARARQAAQAQAAARQAQAQAQAQFQNAQMQAQVQALRNQAYQNGREQGKAEAQAAAEAEINRLNESVRSLLAENKRLKRNVEDDSDLKRQLADAEQDRRELEGELFNRDMELTKERDRADELEAQLNELRELGSADSEAIQKVREEADNLHVMLEKARLCIKKLEQENKKLEQDKKKLEMDKSQFELKNQAQIHLQQDKRRQMQEEIEELHRQVATLTAEVETLRSENDQWQQYAKSEEFLSDAERRIEDWNKKAKADRRKAKSTLYGDLGVLIWATSEEIDDAYNKLCKRYAGKADESIVVKLAKIKEAYGVLSDPVKRSAYNASIAVTEEQIEEERRLIAENESLIEEYRNRIAGKEFWAHYDELTAAALAGDPAAQNSLGEMYYYGDEIENDFEQAVYWFKEAAKQKHPDAMFNLGICFMNGEGIELNIATGQGFIRQAAKLGSKLAIQYEASKK
ncbi:MAG: DnaJ domain-containing protein [Clostridiales bacterium]|nr:DnaJ domain-containing protein [Clostridiales bacterium]